MDRVEQLQNWSIYVNSQAGLPNLRPSKLDSYKEEHSIAFVTDLVFTAPLDQSISHRAAALSEHTV
jgi:hypothetical protein